jgi:diguanylate cyclase (GGDEF)-like protein/PAS domain S-box-containing protein
VTAHNAIAHWRKQIFERLLLVVLVLGTATAIPSAILAVSEGIWAIAAVDAAAIFWLFAIWRLPEWSYNARVISFLAIAFLIGVALMIKVGPVSQIYLMATPVLAALLAGPRPAMSLLALSTLAILLLGVHADPGQLGAGMAAPVFLKPAIIALNYLFITGILTMSSTVLLRHLARSLDEQRLTSAAVTRLNDMVLIAKVVAPEWEGDVPEPRIMFANAAFERRSGYTGAEVAGRSLRLLAGPSTDKATIGEIARAVASQESVRAELLNYSKDGSTYWVEMELAPFADEGGNNTHWVAVERDISERKASEDDIHRLAFYDVLTGLPNRRLLMDRLEKMIASSERAAAFGAVLFIDLDRFKTINDARGHAVGDSLLRAAAIRLQELMRKADTVARIGGDEFVVLLPQLASEIGEAGNAALRVAAKIRDVLAQPFEIEGQTYYSSASIGVTLLPKPQQSIHDLLREADIAMYRAKAEGRNGVAFFEAAMQVGVEQRLTLERDLATALDAGQLEMHIQPQVNGEGQAVGGEMLMRWRRADGTMVPPNVFIPIAEESGLIIRLGQWAMREACSALLRLAEAGHPMPLSVNVSPSQFRQADFTEQVVDALRISGAPASLLILEVTEGLLIEKFDDSVARMRALAAMGIRFSIDDFGTGYSSMAYLKKMPLYELKIDKSFIDDTPSDASAVAIVQAILAMAQQFGLRVVAEGVETRDQADFLIENKCHCLQGYLYGRPMPMPGMLEWLHKTQHQTPGRIA